MGAAAARVSSGPITPAAYRWRHTAMLTSDAELAAAVVDRRRCTALYEQLLPMADEFAVVGAAVFTTGPVALQLGLLAAALGRWDDAARHLGHAVTRCDRLGARLHGDRARAELERLPTARARWRRWRTGGAEPSEIRRDSEVWTSSSAGRAAQFRDAKGLRGPGCPARRTRQGRWPQRIWSPQWRSRSGPQLRPGPDTGPGPNTGPLADPTTTGAGRRAPRHQTISWRRRDALIDDRPRHRPRRSKRHAGGRRRAGVRRSQPGSVTPSAGSSGPPNSAKTCGPAS